MDAESTRMYPAQHKLVGDHPQRKIVCLEGMVELANHFGGHVAGSAAGFVGVLFFAFSGDSEVC